MKAENREKLASVFKYHVLPKRVMAKDVTPMVVKTVGDKSFKVSLESDVVMVYEAKVLETDIVGENGVIHVIKSVLVPPANEAMKKTAKAGKSDVGFKTGDEPGAKK